MTFWAFIVLAAFTAGWVTGASILFACLRPSRRRPRARANR